MGGKRMRDVSRREFLQASSYAALGAGLLKSAPGFAESARENAAIKKAFISFRIGIPQWMTEERFKGLLELFERNKGVTDEVTFFTSETHPPLPLEVIQERATILSRRMVAARELGYRAGVNILATIGHHNENLEHSLSAPYARMTDIAGGTCQGSFCPNDEGMRGYIAEAYKAIATANPDYIWVDDDVRLFGHMPIRCGCFCDNCLAIFEKETSKKYDRAALREAFSQSNVKTKLEIRNAWLDHNRNTLKRLFSLIEKTVHDAKPGLPIGFMTGERFFEGFDFDVWAATLSGPSKSEVMWRPGGGNYTDEWLDGITQKSHQIGRQIALLPGSVASIQSEIESFPYQRLRKSAHATALEAASYIAGGCTGAAYNVLSMYDEPLDEYAPLVKTLRDARPFLDRLASELGRTPCSGVHTGWRKNSFAALNLESDWFDGPRMDPGTGHGDALYTLGLPPAYNAANAKVTALAGDIIAIYSDEEIRRLLSSGVFMDADALTRLNEMGYGALTGFAVENVFDHDCAEQFSSHELNGAFAGRKRDGRQSFWSCPASAFKQTNDAGRPLARLVDYAQREVAPCSSGVFENELGGRICVAGYYPWIQLHGLAKASQMKNVARWLSRDGMPAYVSSFHRVNIWPREREDGKVVAPLLNASLDPANNLELRIKTEKTHLAIIDMQCREDMLTASATDGPYKLFTLPSVGPWDMRLVITA
jgi:hypothetical protein